MSRYIDVDLIVYRLRYTCRDLQVKKVAFEEDIKKIPEADVQEVHHGCWIGKPLEGYSYCCCSRCYKNTYIYVNRNGEASQKYCPFCGSKMDLNTP